MRNPGHASWGGRGHSQAQKAVKQLEHKPEPQDKQRGDPGDLHKVETWDQHPDRGVGVKDQVHGKHPGDGPTGSHTGNAREGSDEHLSQAGYNPGSQVEKGVTHMPQRILNIIAENPQVQHISEQVTPAPVKEHRGEQSKRRPGIAVWMGEEVGDQAPRHKEPLQVGAHHQFHKENEDIEG